MGTIGETPLFGYGITAEEWAQVSPELIEQKKSDRRFPIAVAHFKKAGCSDEQAAVRACVFILAVEKKYNSLRIQGEPHASAERKASIYADGVVSRADPSQIDAAMKIDEALAKAPVPPWMEGRG